jgi:hypothetical protein
MKMQKAAAENNKDGVPELAGREKELRHELYGNALPHELLVIMVMSFRTANICPLSFNNFIRVYFMLQQAAF